MNIKELNDRQRKIIKFAEKTESFQTKDVLAFLEKGIWKIGIS